MRFALIFGKNWALSLAEVLAYFEAERIRWGFVDLTRDALVVEAELDAGRVIEDLGGTLKIAALGKDFNFADFGKQDFGEHTGWPLSFYGEKKLIKEVKKVFRRVPPASVYTHTELIKRRLNEAVLIFGLKTCYFGETVAVSNPFDYQKRDLGRPCQRPELSISPSRGRILVNLSQAKQSLLDPFCGVGTIGQEAMLRGIDTINLSDADKGCVEWTRKNMEWAKKRFGYRGNFFVHACDARRLGERYKTESVEAIASEPDLGPMLKSRPSEADAKKIIGYLSDLYHLFFKSAHPLLMGGGRIAIVFPCINSRSGKIFVDKWFGGFRLADPFEKIPQEYRNYLRLRKTVLDEERETGKFRITAREFCIFFKE